MPTFIGVRDFTHLLFDWRQQGVQFRVDASDEILRERVERCFLDRYRSPPLRYFNLGGRDDLDDLLRAVAWHLMVDGKTALVMLWENEGGSPEGEKMPQFLLADPTAVSRRRDEGGYRIAVPKTWPGAECEERIAEEAEVSWFDWPLDPVIGHGISPVDRVVELHLRHDELMELSVEIMRALVEVEDLSLRTERARWIRLSDVNKELREVSHKISAELFGLVSDQPMTAYFDVYQVLRANRFRAIVRESLVEKFNQLVQAFSLRVCPEADPARLELVNYPTAEDIEQAIISFTNREIDAKEAIRISSPSKPDTTT